MKPDRFISGLVLTLVFAALGAGCMGGRKISYSPVVRQNLDHLRYLTGEMATASGTEAAVLTAAPTPEAVERRRSLLSAISRGTVSEVGESLGGFYLPGSESYEGVYQGGLSDNVHELDTVEKAQLDQLMVKVMSGGKYTEDVQNFYEREVAQAASPVVIDGKVAAIAWIRFRLPTTIRSVVDKNKFDSTATRKQQQR